MNIRELSDTKQVHLEKDVEFTVKVLSPKVYRKLSAELARARRLFASGEQSTEQDLEKALKNPERYEQASEALHEAFRAFVRHGIAGHQNVRRGGQEVSFSLNADATMTEELLDLYDLQRWIIPLGNEVIAFNTLSEEEVKN